MKTLILTITLGIALATSSYSQNNAPIAVNDTFYVTFNDSIGMYQFSGSLIVSNPNSLNFLSNDSDPNANLFYIDTAFYNGLGYFSIVTDSINPTWKKSSIGYKPSLNFWGIDSIQYVIKDNGVPVMYDTATIYFWVKHKEFQQLDLNNINARLGLYGLFQDMANSTASFEVPKGSGTSTMYAANLWIAGKNQDSVYASCETFGSILASTNSYTSFHSRSGPIMDSAYYQEYDFKWDRLWKITSNEINYHINNWMNGGYQPIEVIANWPAHGDTSKGQDYYLAPFVDNNGDGIYNPYDGDYPKIKGQQAVYFIYNDVRAISGSGGSMHAEVHYMAYAYNCPSDSAINNTIFLDYTVYNRSNLTYDSTYIGAWTDFDIGGSTDDYVACDVDRSTFYAYNADAVDEAGSGILGYGNYPPAQGVTFLKGVQQVIDGVDNNFGINANETINGLGFGDGTTDNEHWGMEHFIYYSIGGGFQGDPQNGLDYYDYLSGKWTDGSTMVYGGNGHVSSGGTIPAKYMYPDSSDSFWYGTGGIPQAYWSEFNEGNPSGDRRGMGSTGPFTFYPDSSIEITLAYVFGRDYQTTGNQAGVVVMQERIDSIRSYYSTDFVSVCGGTLGVSENATKKEQIVAVYPNPFNNELTVYYELEKNTATLEIYNLMGEKIKMQLLNQPTTVIDLSNQANGIYFITIVDGNSRISRKVVKH